MKAMVYTKYGTKDVLNLVEVEKPTPKDNEVLVRVHAASVNSWDWDLLRGKPYLVRLGGMLKPKYSILGADIAGIVEAVGREVKQFHPGDEVFGDISGSGWGGFAEYVSVRETVLSYKPSHLTFEEAAALPQAGVLALQGLRDKGKIQKGQKILVNGAGGGVGTIAVQFAKSVGAEVVAVDRREKLDMLTSIGADEVIDYTTKDFAKNGHKYDLILDVVGNRTIFDYKRALSPSGFYVMVGGSMARIFQVMCLGPWISMTEKKKMGILIHKPNQHDQKELGRLVEAGVVTPIIDKYYPLSEVAEAIQYLGEGYAKGKVMIRILD
ncbi:NAD(P)-dependent alcohol dehydrogenase [Paenibacillus sp. CGMCC 1.16610]|uniref:Zinc-binding dehydrogenase n=1 Tax=Paenibacillus anseongense TaxID=2682845 RepID=A0ABW9ULL5_9BACL|nr:MULTISPECIES: NAD(P)-dependent alcohol dehydrogenase [Paenibacillus]MBA2941295.1 NAD(P)-dependent alcohol dehydrogenase [Paenibacillus sp. CGMCC 1.16610]MVQ40115.1 zinc-binding dehydrogenase [Paenibacillus anseongense]